MEKVSFKKEHQHHLYHYLNVLIPYSDTSAPTIRIEKELYSYQFHYYIALAEFLTEHLNKYVILRISPYLANQSFIKEVETVNWKYLLLANDYEGLGIDNGFINIRETSDEEHALFSVGSLLSLRELPEDTFGDKVSNVSVFGLTSNSVSDLQHFLHSAKQPDLSEFLQKGDLFINIISSKQMGYYHSMLIKSNDDIETELDAFQNVIAPDN